MSERNSGTAWKWIVVAAVMVIATAAVAASRLKSAAEVLGSPANASAKSSAASGRAAPALLADIEKFREESARLAPDLAARRWFELYDRAKKLGRIQFNGEFDSLDAAINSPVGTRSLFASLPPPASWKALRDEATRRATAAPDRESLALRYLAELLTAERAAATRTLADLEQLIAKLPPEERDELKSSVRDARFTLARLYGSVDERLAILAESLRTGQEYETLLIPDLVAMVGEARANGLLDGVMTSRMQLDVEGGAATRALLQRLALANIERMRVPQWGLVDTVEAAPLYEALEKRFPRANAGGENAERDMSDYARATATVYYFLAAVKDGRQSVAERALDEIARDNVAYIPRDAFAALERAGLGEAVYRFLDAQLEKRPQLRAWDIYIEQAAKNGHGADALALIEKLMARPGLPDYLLAELRSRRIAALLAADRIEPAVAEFRVLLATPPAAGQKDLAARVGSAIQLAKIGRLLGRKDLAKVGLDFALSAARLEKGERRGSPQQDSSLLAELRRQGRVEDAQSLAIAALHEAPTQSEGFQALTDRIDSVGAAALVELSGIYSAAGQHADVVELLDKSAAWGVGDVARFLQAKDSLDVPFGAIVARALDATGDKAGALRVARATVSALPGRDLPYEIIANLDPNAAQTFETLFASDEFEERPLIWKAVVLLRSGKVEDAERDVRRAIAVDPSDGEEGANDRMRAYAVLADILRRKGATQDARLFDNAVGAIRLSERADEFYYAGLLERAFKTYREGLEKFSDAYCIQSRLAVQLNKVGRRQEALEHYRRAYELMPGSFGRVESHCFGCESVFADPESQTIAERVFTDVIRKSPARAQAHYLLAYLREQQGDFAAAVQPLRAAVGIDGRYLNAWKRLDEIAEKTYLEAGERDIARLKLLELDPLRRHSSYALEEIGQLAALWNGAERALKIYETAGPARDGVRPFPASAAVRDEAIKSLPEEMRAQMEQFRRLGDRIAGVGGVESPLAVLASHVLVKGAMEIASGEPAMPELR